MKKILLIAAILCAQFSFSQVLFSEIVVSPPGADLPNEYIELVGTPGTMIPANTYYVAVEGDGDNPGRIRDVLDLSGLTLGSNGYLVILTDGNPYSVDMNATTATFEDLGQASTTSTSGYIADLSATHFLIITETAPTSSNDIDSDNDGTPDGIFDDWTVLDGIANIDNDDRDVANGGNGEFAYSNLIFHEFFDTGNNDDDQTGLFFPAGAELVVMGTSDPSYLGRIPGSIGNTSADWVVGGMSTSNLPPGVIWKLSSAANTEPDNYGGASINHVGSLNFPTFVPPSVQTITLQGTPAANATEITYTVTFDRNANNITTDDFELTTTGDAAGTIASVSAASGTSVAVVINAITGTGSLRLDLLANTDIANDDGNGESAEAFINGDVHIVDLVAPANYTIMIDQDLINLSNQNAVSYTLAGAEVDATYSYTANSDNGGTEVTGSGSITDPGQQITDIDISRLEDGTITLQVILTDAAGNQGQSVSDTVSKDTTAPSVTITSSENSPTTADLIPVTITFSESITGFDISDVVVNGGTSQNFTGSDDNYTFDIIPTAVGAITVDIAADAAIDSAGNGSIAATQFSIEFSGTLNTQDHILLRGITLSPNPAIDNLTIRNESNFKIDFVRILDIQGKLILQQHLETKLKSTSIDISNLESGLYLVEMNSENSFAVKRIIKN